VHARVDVLGDWKAMEQLGAALHRLLPSGPALSSTREKLEGKAQAKVQFISDLPTVRIVTVAMANQHDGKQTYGVALIAFPPMP
jgi:hypothetical protein